MKNTILFGDCRDTLPTIDVKARMCVTSPPYYGLRNYGDEGKSNRARGHTRAIHK